MNAVEFQFLENDSFHRAQFTGRKLTDHRPESPPHRPQRCRWHLLALAQEKSDKKKKEIIPHTPGSVVPFSVEQKKANLVNRTAGHLFYLESRLAPVFSLHPSGCFFSCFPAAADRCARKSEGKGDSWEKIRARMPQDRRSHPDPYPLYPLSQHSSSMSPSRPGGWLLLLHLLSFIAPMFLRTLLPIPAYSLIAVFLFRT